MTLVAENRESLQKWKGGVERLEIRWALRSSDR